MVFFGVSQNKPKPNINACRQKIGAGRDKITVYYS